MLLSIDGTFVVQLINFVIFFVIVNAVFMKPVRAAIAKRRAYIDSVTNDFDTYTAKVGELRTEAQQTLSTARRDAEAAIAQARSSGQREAAEITGRYGAEAAAETARAHEQVDAEMQVARRDEERLIRELADDLTTRALGGVVA